MISRPLLPLDTQVAAIALAEVGVVGEGADTRRESVQYLPVRRIRVDEGSAAVLVIQPDEGGLRADTRRPSYDFF